MTTAFLRDAFAHHAWATERLIDACATLTRHQLHTATPGTYGSIAATLRHLVASDRWHLSFYPPGQRLSRIDEEADVSLADLRSAAADNAEAWNDVLAAETDPDREVLEMDDALEVHSPVGVRLAQAIHHGTDHRSQVCTALTGFGVEPPEIDVWAYARETGRERAVQLDAAPDR